jgi:hypothetical protein
MDVLCKYINEFTLSAMLLGGVAADVPQMRAASECARSLGPGFRADKGKLSILQFLFPLSAMKVG